MYGLHWNMEQYSVAFRAWTLSRCDVHNPSSSSYTWTRNCTQLTAWPNKYIWSPPIFEIHLCVMHSCSWASGIRLIEDAWFFLAAMKCLRSPSSLEAMYEVGLLFSLLWSFSSFDLPLIDDSKTLELDEVFCKDTAQPWSFHSSFHRLLFCGFLIFCTLRFHLRVDMMILIIQE